MLNITHTLGIDPGLVHTGVVSALWQPELRQLSLAHTVLNGYDPDGLDAHLDKVSWLKPVVFIEDYRIRSGFRENKRMAELVRDYRNRTHGKALDNMGVKKVVKRQLMETLGMWKWATPTHHDDLRSAARIMLLGMLKDDGLNALVSRAVRDHLDGLTWSVTHQ